MLEESLELEVRRCLMSQNGNADRVLELLIQKGAKDLSSAIKELNRIVPDVIYFDCNALSLVTYLDNAYKHDDRTAPKGDD